MQPVSEESVRVALGIRREITRLILSQGCGLSSLKFSPLQMKVAAEVGNRMQSLPAVNFLQAFFCFVFCSCKSQVEVSPIYAPSNHTSLLCVVLWSGKLSNQWNLRRLCEFGRGGGGFKGPKNAPHCQQHIQCNGLKQNPSSV